MNIKVNTTLIIYLAIVICCTSCVFAPGSYPYAERYELNCSESDLIDAIEKFKIENPQYNTPNHLQLTDGRSDNKDNWYHVYFSYKNEHEIIYTWVQGLDKTTTIFAFVSISKGDTLGYWKNINDDFSDEENNLQKEKFERLILNKIKKSME